MNSAQISHVTATSGLPANRIGRCYASAIVYNQNGIIIHRYLSPSGWQKTSHYYDKETQLRADLVKFPENTRPVTQSEINMQRDLIESSRHDYEEDDDRDYWDTVSTF
jgi:hypothetical protein